MLLALHDHASADSSGPATARDRGLGAGRFLRRALVPAVLVVAWGLAQRHGPSDWVLVPGPLDVWRAFVELVGTGELASHLGASLRRLAAGYAVAAGAGVGLGVLVGGSGVLDDLLHWVMEVLRPVPPIALIPFAILWLGIGDEPKVMIIAFGAFFPTFVNTVAAVRSVDRTVVSAARLLAARRSFVLRKVVLPAAMPQVFTGLRISLGLSFVLLLASEMVAANSGLGFLVLDSERMYRTDRVVAAVFTISACSVLSGWLMRRFEQRAFRWYFASRWRFGGEVQGRRAAGAP